MARVRCVQEQATRELSQALQALHFLTRVAPCPAATVLDLCDALTGGMLRLAPRVLEDGSSLAALAVRQAQFVLLEGMRCRCARAHSPALDYDHRSS